jgi:hypothetical protein
MFTPSLPNPQQMMPRFEARHDAPVRQDGCEVVVLVRLRSCKQICDSWCCFVKFRMLVRKRAGCEEARPFASAKRLEALSTRQSRSLVEKEFKPMKLYHATSILDPLSGCDDHRAITPIGGA